MGFCTRLSAFDHVGRSQWYSSNTGDGKTRVKDPTRTHYDLKKTLNTLLELPLYKNQLPNREYSTKSGKPSGRLSDTASNGSGWSALDIGRLLIWLKIICQEHPHLIEEVSSIISRWNLDKAVNKGHSMAPTLVGEKNIIGRKEEMAIYNMPQEALNSLTTL